MFWTGHHETIRDVTIASRVTVCVPGHGMGPDIGGVSGGNSSGSDVPVTSKISDRCGISIAKVVLDIRLAGVEAMVGLGSSSARSTLPPAPNFRGCTCHGREVDIVPSIEGWSDRPGNQRPNPYSYLLAP